MLEDPAHLVDEGDSEEKRNGRRHQNDIYTCFLHDDFSFGKLGVPLQHTRRMCSKGTPRPKSGGSPHHYEAVIAAVLAITVSA